MKAFSVDSQTQEVIEHDITMAANTVYTFFSSILIDELSSLKEHVIYSDANALSENKRAYFIGEQLIIGDALILGREDFNDVDATISKKDLNSLINPNINDFYKEVLNLISNSDINLYRTFIVEKNNEKIALNIEWVLYTFNIADERTKEYFINELKKLLMLKEVLNNVCKKWLS